MEARGPCGAGNYGKAVEGRKRGGLRLVSVLELANISKHFGAIQAVNDV
ncbi:MAG: sugar ABC transporter ATP-binding protein, partial [Mesorhizobium sp.]